MGNPQAEMARLLRTQPVRFDKWGRRDALALVIGAAGCAALALARKVWP